MAADPRPAILLLLITVLFLSAKAQEQGHSSSPHGTVHSYSNDVDTKLLPDFTAIELSTDFTFGEVSEIQLRSDGSTVVSADGNITVFRDGLPDSRLPIHGDCEPQRLLIPPDFGLIHQHCFSTSGGQPQWSVNGEIYRLPDTTPGSFLPQVKNSVFSVAVDADFEDDQCLVVINRDGTSLSVKSVHTRWISDRGTVPIDDCDRITGITYQEPTADRQIRFILTCFQGEALKYFAVQLDNDFRLGSIDELRFSGDVLSLVTRGDRVCFVETSMLTCFLTTQPTRLPDILHFSGNIANAEFFTNDQGRMFLLVEVNGTQHVMFTATSAGITNRSALPQSEAFCPKDDKCLPHLVFGRFLFLFKWNNPYFRAQLYDLNSPLSDPEFRGNTRLEPKMAVFEAQTPPTENTTPTSEPSDEATTNESTTDEPTTDEPTTDEPTTNQDTTPTDSTTKTEASTGPTDPPSAQPIMNMVGLAIGISLAIAVVVAGGVFFIVAESHRRSKKDDPEHGCPSYYTRCLREKKNKKNPDKINGGRPLEATEEDDSATSRMSDGSSDLEVTPRPDTGPKTPDEMVVGPKTS